MNYFDQLSKNYSLEVPREHESNAGNKKNVFLMAVPNDVFQEMKQGSCFLKKNKLKTKAG